ncbi:hypothetical protein Nepgr_018809 [Nepenthes gracilis]|uniref:Uncharacterized protein n=1 Tax=Nepenthes gracilis TaxID=150966 RepID=A0AAD3SS09_NEPGR|nr:hypothetical protein Nepgr_018809 [Nepenthes gracilis]
MFRPTGKILPNVIPPPLRKVTKSRHNSEASCKAGPVKEFLPVSNSFATLQEGEMESKYQTNSEIILSNEMKNNPNGKDCSHMESDDPISLAWSLSEHQQKPTKPVSPWSGVQD